jgi:signal peptidase II
MNAAALTTTPKPALSESGVRLLWISLLVIVLDQFTKELILRYFDHHDRMALLPFLEFVRAHNLGAAWSMLADAGGWQRWAFSGLATVVSLGLMIWLRHLSTVTQRLLAFGIALIVGGAIGNLIDRVRLGAVTDFVHVYWGSWSFPAFNVADAAISIGAACVILDSLIDEVRARRAAKAAGGGG